jgi:hypothetical protein
VKSGDFPDDPTVIKVVKEVEVDAA